MEDRLASDLRGFGPIGLLAILAILAGNFIIAPLSALLVLAWAWRSGTPWRDIGYVRPKSWLGDLLLGSALGVTLRLFIKAIVMPLLGANPINSAYRHLEGNTAALPGMIVLIVVVAGFGEETVFRGFLFERLERLFGTGVLSKASIVLVTSAWFGLAHYAEQGLAGVQQSTLVGLAFGTVFAVTGRLWLLMCAHVAFDLLALATIYLGLEQEIAHLVFG